MRKTHVLMLLSLFLSTSCSNSAPPCGKRSPYDGRTYGDAVTYLGNLERLYDACSA